MNYNKKDRSNDPEFPQGSPPVVHPEPMAHYQPIRVERDPRRDSRRRRRSRLGCCLFWLLLPLMLVCLAVGGVLLLRAPSVTFLVLGIDRPPEGTNVSRSDTMILVKADPTTPKVSMLSIPRDLWVTIPGVGENRINTAHFFAEGKQKGSGPQAAMQVVQTNFGVPVKYYLRLKFDSLVEIIDAMGGVDLDLPSSMGGLAAGKHHLNGTEALKFARDRQGTDDFFRMQQGQVLIKAVFRQMFSPLTWIRLPNVIRVTLSMIDTNMTPIEWAAAGAAVIRTGIDKIDSRTIPRESATPTVTTGGASVLVPNWPKIKPMVQEMFGK